MTTTLKAASDIKTHQGLTSSSISLSTREQQLKQKKNLLEQYKKGVTQKIFTQELRFKDDSDKDFPKWEKFKITQIQLVNRPPLGDDAMEGARVQHACGCTRAGAAL